MGRSIRWTLLAGLGLLLAGVIATFGGLLYLRVRESLMNSIDSELAAQAQAIAAAVTAVSEDRFEIALSDSQSRYFQATGHLVIWNRQGEIVDYSDPDQSGVPLLKSGARQRGGFREVAVAGPAGTTILAGRSNADQLAQLLSLRALILGLGVSIFAGGMLGGWFLIGRILAPLRRITETAATISESNLSSRIDVGATENELESLARTLNATFDRLEASVRRLGQFTADAAHELRTPITVLMTQLELALKKPRAPEEYREALDTCLKTVRRMADLAEGLLFLSRADAGAVEWRQERLDLEGVVDETVRLVKPLADSRGIAIAVALEPHPVVGDRVRLGEAVMNLVTNAIQHNRAAGKVEISLHGGILSVADTGTGIAEEDRPHLFQRFYRADKARSRNAGGAGLGLAITKAIVEGHGGKIDFECGDHCGTVFRIRLPAAPIGPTVRFC